MSTAETPEPLEATAMDQLPAAEAPTARKSYRRKYRKIMVNFEEKMRESNSLFKDEQRIFDISQRLAEQTDQLLQLLSDVNSCPQVPKRMRYNLRPTGRIQEPAPDSNPVFDEEGGHLTLRKARYQLQIGEISVSEYRDLQSTVLNSAPFAPDRSYSGLVKYAPLPSSYHHTDADPSTQNTGGFLSAKQEDQYLQGLDSFLGGASENARPHAAGSLGNRNAERTAEREREMQLRNPVSVYNWLRKHQPQVFLQDNEAGTDKPAKSAGSRSSKRMANRDSAVKVEPDVYDDEGVAVERGAGSRGKRKRPDDDSGYRPKGGNSRPSKRKKEDVPPPGSGRRGKKMAVDAR